MSLSEADMTLACITQLLGGSHNLTRRSMHLLKYIWALLFIMEKLSTDYDEREQVITDLSWIGLEKLLKCLSTIPVTSLYCVSNSCNYLVLN